MTVSDDDVREARDVLRDRLQHAEAQAGAYRLAHDHLAAVTRQLVDRVTAAIGPSWPALVDGGTREALDPVRDALSRDLESYLADPDNLTADTRLDLTPAGLAVATQRTLPCQPGCGIGYHLQGCPHIGAQLGIAPDGSSSHDRAINDGHAFVPYDPGAPEHGTCQRLDCGYLWRRHQGATRAASVPHVARESGPAAAPSLMPMPESWGPYETELQTRLEPMSVAVNELHDAGLVRAGDPERVVRDLVLAHLKAAAEAAGVKLGAYDRRILAWLARGELPTAQVVIGLIRRAFQGGRGSQRCPDTLRGQATMEGDDTIMVIMVPYQKAHCGLTDVDRAEG